MEDNKYWFKTKRYGYGFYPVTKEGWITILAYLVFVTLLSLIFGKDLEEGISSTVFWYTFGIASSTAFLIILSYKKGPRPRWRWGKRETDNPEEDF